MIGCYENDCCIKTLKKIIPDIYVFGDELGKIVVVNIECSLENQLSPLKMFEIN